ncbi:MAG: NAD(P)H-dependent oxidoreductase [Succinivibrionaceae bacterium]|nr:NAD(P)H-dependent oxidoreductase [Succinivibrionaceae bacterium]
MKNVLLINGAKAFGHSGGRLNASLQALARKVLGNELAMEIKETVIDAGYDPEAEAQKILWADALIWQMPGWWMGEPWIVKKYIDEVFSAGGARFLSSDGRHRANPAVGYGTGGLLQGKRYMFSVTWNAPLEAFERPEEFFGGVGVDGVYLHLHKAMEFIGMSRLPTFICNDVMKNPRFEEYCVRYSAHLKAAFSAP